VIFNRESEPMFVLPVEMRIDDLGRTVYSFGLVARHRVGQFFAGGETIFIPSSRPKIFDNRLVISSRLLLHRYDHVSGADNVYLDLLRKGGPQAKSTPFPLQTSRSQIADHVWCHSLLKKTAPN